MRLRKKGDVVRLSSYLQLFATSLAMFALHHFDEAAAVIVMADKRSTMSLDVGTASCGATRLRRSEPGSSR